MLARLVCLFVVGLLVVGAPASIAVGADPTSRVTFNTTPAAVGDAIDQQIRFELRLKSRVHQGAEVLDEKETNKVRAHARRITTTEVTEGRTTGVRLVYGEATEKAVAGKTYLCRREGDAVRVTDAQGKIPTLAEFNVVARHMQMLGKPNPLSAFLRGKTIAVGETVDVPVQVAAELFGPELFGGADWFRLTLNSVDESSGKTLARFDSAMSVVASDGTQTRMEVSGPIAVDAATSRLLETDLLGPIAMNQSRQDPRGLLQVSATGRFTVSLKTTPVPSRVARSRGGRLLRF